MRKEREKFGRTSEGPFGEIIYVPPLDWNRAYRTVFYGDSTTPIDSFTYLSDSTTWPDNPGWSTTWTEEVQ